MSQSAGSKSHTTVRVDSEFAQAIETYKIAVGAASKNEALRRLVPPFGRENVDLEALDEYGEVAEQVQENADRIRELDDRLDIQKEAIRRLREEQE